MKQQLSCSAFAEKSEVKQTSIRNLIDNVLDLLETGFSIVGLIPDYSTLKIVTMYDPDFDHVQIKASMKGE